jgi:hypothetical protein
LHHSTLALQLKHAGFVPSSVLDGDDAERSPHPQFVNGVKDRLRSFLESVDRCDVLFLDMHEGQFVFLVAAHNAEHLPLIRNAVAQERILLNGLGIDARDVTLQGDFIRIHVPLPEEHDA